MYLSLLSFLGLRVGNAVGLLHLHPDFLGERIYGLYTLMQKFFKLMPVKYRSCLIVPPTLKYYRTIFILYSWGKKSNCLNCKLLFGKLANCKQIHYLKSHWCLRETTSCIMISERNLLKIK